MCARCSGCFLLAFLTGSWCGVQLRTGKRPFLSTVNHLRAGEKKKIEKKERGEKKKKRRETRPLHWFNPLQSGLLFSLLVSPSLFSPHSLYRLFLLISAFFFQYFFLVVYQAFLALDSALEGNRQVPTFHKSRENWGCGAVQGGRKAEEAVLCEELCRFFRFSFCVSEVSSNWPWCEVPRRFVFCCIWSSSNMKRGYNDIRSKALQVVAEVAKVTEWKCVAVLINIHDVLRF